MWWIRWFCLPLAFKFWQGDLLLDSPTHDQACTRRTYFLPPSFYSSFSNVYFRAQGVGAGGVAHFTFQFIKQFVCDYVNVLRLTQATVWTSGVPPQL